MSRFDLDTRPAGLSSGVADQVLWFELARQALLDARLDEFGGDLTRAGDGFTSALARLEQREIIAPEVARTRACALAGIARVQLDDAARERAAAAFEALAEEDLDAADVADRASLLDGAEAREMLLSAILRGDSPPWASLRLGLLELQAGDFAAAGPHLRRARLAAPLDAGCLEAWAEWLQRSAKPAASAAAFTSAAALRALDDDLEIAREHAWKARTEDPSDPAARLVAADLLRALDDGEQAARLLEPLIDDDTVARDEELHRCVTRVRAAALADDGHRRDALKALQPLLVGDGALADDLLLAGLIEAELGDHDAADAWFRQAVAEAPERIELVHALARHHLQQGRLSDAASAVDAAIDANLERGVQSPELLVMLGDLRCRAGDDASPAPEIEKARLMGLPAADAWTTIAEIRWEDGERTGALEALERALQLKPEDGRLHARRGELALEDEQFALAVSELRRAVELLPDDPAIRLRLGEAYFRADDIDASEREVDSAVLKAHHDSALYARLRGLRGMLRAVQDRSAAVEDLRAALKISPSLAWVAAELFSIFAQYWGDDQAAEQLVHVMKAADADGEDIRGMAEELRQRKRAAGAVTFLEAYLGSGDELAVGDRAALIVEVSRARADDGDGEGAAASLLQARDLVPGNAAVRAELAVALAVLGRSEEAIAEAKAARRTDPGSADVALDAARALHGADGPQAALAELEAAVDQIGDDPALLALHAELLIDVERPKDAQRLARRMRRRWPRLPAVDRLEGLALAAQGKCGEARPLLESALVREPSDGDVRTKLAGALVALDEPHAALEVLSAIAPVASIEASVYLAEALAAVRREPDALAVLEGMLERYPDLARVRVRLVEVASSLGDTELVDAHLRILLDHEQNAGDVDIARVAWTVMGDRQSALDRLDVILQSTPGDARALLLRGQILFETGEPEEAIAALGQALEHRRQIKRDQQVYARLMLADACLATERPHEALESLGSKRHPLIDLKRATVLFALDQPDKAIESALALLASHETREDPDGLMQVDDMLERVVDLFTAEERQEEAATLLDQRFGEDPEQPPGVLRAAGSLLSSIGEFERAAAVLERARAQDADTVGLDDELAWAYTNLDEPPVKLLEAAVGRALAAWPDNPWLLTTRADALYLGGDVAPALELYDEILRNHLDSVPSMRQRHSLAGWCCYRAEYLERAVDHCQRAVSIEVPYATSDRLDLGLVLLACGRTTMGAVEYRRALDELRSTTTDLPRRGLLRSSLVDLDRAMRYDRIKEIPEVHEIRSALSDAIDACAGGMERIASFLARFPSGRVDA